MSHTILKSNAPDSRGMFAHLLDSAEMTWQHITRNISIGAQKGGGDFRIPDPAPSPKSTSGSKGVGHAYKKTGSIAKR